MVILLTAAGITTLVPPNSASLQAPTVPGGISIHASAIQHPLPALRVPIRIAEVEFRESTPYETGAVSAHNLVASRGLLEKVEVGVAANDSSLGGVSSLACGASAGVAAAPDRTDCSPSDIAAATSDATWSLSAPTAAPASIDLGQNVTFTAVIRNANASDHFSYVWIGLPKGCASHDKKIEGCTPAAVGSFSVQVNVTANNSSKTSPATKFKVNADPTITSFGASPSTLLVGTSTVFTVQESFGMSPFQYSYTGLPSGCPSTNAAKFSCTPTSTGKYTVEVTLQDATGSTATLNTTIEVTPRVLGLPPLEGYAVIGGAVAFVALLTLVLVVVRMRHQRARKRAASAPATQKSPPSEPTPPVSPSEQSPPPPGPS